MPERGFSRLRWRVPDALREELAAAVWTEGFLGLESRREGGETVLDCWYRQDAQPPELGDRWTERGARLVGRERVADEDWLRVYRESAAPFDLGRSWRVDPGEPDAARRPVGEAGGRRLLRIPARRAFGTGTHETTRLAAGLLEDEALDGRRVLDVGCGTGILSLMAELLGARFVVAVDVDPAAVFNARQTARLNALGPRLVAGRVEALRDRGSFDVVVANILPGHVLESLPLLASQAREGGHVLYTGAREEEAACVEEALVGAGLELTDRRVDGGWLGWAGRRIAG